MSENTFLDAMLIAKLINKGKGESLPQYVQDGLFYYTDKDIGKVGSQAVIGKGLDFSNGYTFEVCAKITSTNNEYMRLLEFAPYGSDIASATVIASKNYGYIDLAVNGDWYHDDGASYAYPVGRMMTISLAADISNRVAYMYIDGELVVTINNINSSTSDMSAGGWFYLGCGSVSYRLLDGNVYSGRYYNRMLSAAEMAKNRAVDAERFRQE